MFHEAYVVLIGKYTENAPTALLKIILASAAMNSEVQFKVIVNDNDFEGCAREQRRSAVFGERERFPENILITTVSESMNETIQELDTHISRLAEREDLARRDKESMTRYARAAIFTIKGIMRLTQQYRDGTEQYLTACLVKDVIHSALSLRPSNGKSTLTFDADVCLLHLTECLTGLSDSGTAGLMGMLEEERPGVLNVAERIHLLLPSPEVHGMHTMAQSFCLESLFSAVHQEPLSQYMISGDVPKRRSAMELDLLGQMLFKYVTQNDSRLTKYVKPANTLLFLTSVNDNGEEEIGPEDKDAYDLFKVKFPEISRECYVTSSFMASTFYTEDDRALSAYTYDKMELYSFLMHGRTFLSDERLIDAKIACDSVSSTTVEQRELCGLYNYFYSAIGGIASCGRLTPNDRLGRNEEIGIFYEYLEKDLLESARTIKADADRKMTEKKQQRAGNTGGDNLVSNVISRVALSSTAVPSVGVLD